MRLSPHEEKEGFCLRGLVWGKNSAPGVFEGQNRRRVKNMFQIQKRQIHRQTLRIGSPHRATQVPQELSAPSLRKLG